jgi:hypothetical protein
VGHAEHLGTKKSAGLAAELSSQAVLLIDIKQLYQLHMGIDAYHKTIQYHHLWYFLSASVMTCTPNFVSHLPIPYTPKCQSFPNAYATISPELFTLAAQTGFPL